MSVMCHECQQGFYNLNPETMIQIANTQECFVELWLLLERTRRLHLLQRKRFCIRNILKTWLDHRAKDDFIFEVCLRAETVGWNELPPPQVEPRPHRELLRALTSVTLDIGMRKVDLHALDKAYSIAFPDSMPINVRKRRREIKNKK